MPKKKGLFKAYKPKVKLTSKGVKVQKPRAKIGGMNISSKGVSHSVKTPIGTYNTRKGLTLSKKGCPFTALVLLTPLVLIIAVLAMIL